MVKLFYSDKTKKIYSILPALTTYTKLPPFYTSHDHHHPVYHMVFIFSGSGSIELDTFSRNLTEGDILLINPNEKHIFRTTDSELYYYALNFMLLKETEHFDTIADCMSVCGLNYQLELGEKAAQLPLESILDIRTSNSCLIYDKSQWNIIKMDIQAFHSYIQNYLKEVFVQRMGNSNGLNYAMKVYDFLFSLYTRFLQQEEKEFNKINDTILLKIILYLEENIGRKMNLTNLANDLKYNASYISKIFKQKMNLTISEYFTLIKIKKACDLLRSSNMSITDIAYLLGYNSSQHFSRSFKEIRKITPSEFRNNLEYF